MGECRLCGRRDITISSFLGVCGRCIKERFWQIKDYIFGIHPALREKKVSQNNCPLCINRCALTSPVTICGLRGLSQDNPTKEEAYLEYYYDFLPTNCVAEKFCAATGCGYPHFSYSPYLERGHKNLAIFFYGCSFNCLFCQNYTWRDIPPRKVSIEEIIKAVDEETSCICFFGGDPSCQMDFALNLSYQIIKRIKRIVRVCWETNGSFNSYFSQDILKILKMRGGTIKFDLKFFNENLNIALCGQTNRTTLDNFSFFAKNFSGLNPPLVCASTLVIPGYTDEEEIFNISCFIAQFSKDIPYVLLGFWPQFYFKDLPPTSKEFMYRCFKIAKKVLNNVEIGNIHLLT